MNYFEPISTRLFPVRVGADRYSITGIAAKCDWVILSDPCEPRTQLEKIGSENEPKYVFLSLRSPFLALRFFFYEVLPQIHNRFVLISGSEDITIPRQLDKRWRSFNDDEAAVIAGIANDKRVVHWFCENLDHRFSNKVSPLPLGLTFREPPSSGLVLIPEVPPLTSRSFKAFCCHRVRSGSQWEVRRRVTDLCLNRFSDSVTVFVNEIDEASFAFEVSRHSFVICVSGGGLDPSPKAWLSMIYGAIPIIRSSVLDEVYKHLPVYIIEDWDDVDLSADALYSKRDEIINTYPFEKRTEVIRRLGLDYWWNKVSEKLSCPYPSS